MWPRMNPEKDMTYIQMKSIITGVIEKFVLKSKYEDDNFKNHLLLLTFEDEEE